MNHRPAALLTAFLGLCPLAPAEPPFIAGLQRDGTSAVAGAVLVGELGCAACHQTRQAAYEAKPGPDLSAVGARVTAAHLRRFIASPSGVKPGTTMPDVLAPLPGEQREEVARAIAQYLSSLGKPPAESPSPNAPERTETTPAPADAIERGASLYHSVGCVACHAPEGGLPDSVPLGPLGEKYSVSSLAAFLERPLEVRPGARMPDCRLERSEAADIASYLLREQKARPPAPLPDGKLPDGKLPDGTLVDRGRALFVQHRCQACHSTGEKLASPALPAFNRLRANEGCLSESPGAWPRYPLSEPQRSALRAAVADEGKSWSPDELVPLVLTRLNCLACHQRDGLGGIVSARNGYFTGSEESLGEQGRLPPPLTGVGAKLKAPWLRDVIATGAGVRTTLRTRMPKFGAAHAESLATWFKQLDTLPPLTFQRVPESARPHAVGRDLAGAKGLNCIACHTFRERTAALHGPELTTMTERLEENWFHHFLAQPQRFAPLTVMPGFWPDGKSALPDVLGGDPGQQRDALWQFLAQGPEAGEPAGLVLEPLVITVGDEAVIVRRAFPGIGKRGLGVGLPGGLNFAFDAEQMRLASLWSGGFIEASGLWRGQGAGQAHILGKDTVHFPPGPAFAALATAHTAWPVPDPTPHPSPFSFQGYTLDAQRRPALRYTVDGFAVEDTFHERRDASGVLFLERTLKFPAPPPAGLHFRVAADKTIDPRGDDAYAVGSAMVVKLPAPGLVRPVGDTKELLVPVIGGELKINYHLTSPR